MPSWLAKILLLVLSAALLTLAFAPVGQFYLAWVGLVPWMMVLTRTRSKKSAFMWSWIAGTMFFAVNMWWVWKVTLPGMLVLLVYLGLFWGLAGWILVGCGLIPRALDRSAKSAPLRVAAKRGVGAVRSIVFIAIIWTALEWLRGNWSMFGNQGLPWLYLGATQSPFLLMCQSADIGGVYAVSFWVVLMNALIFWIVQERKRIAIIAPAIASVGLITVAISIYGTIRMRQGSSRIGPVVVVIQPNYPQSNSGEKGAPPEEILRFHVAMTKTALAECARRGIKVDLVAWSETMMPPLNQSAREIERKYGTQKTFQDAFDALSELANANDVALIVGGAMEDQWDEKNGMLIATDRRNSAYLFERSGLISPVRYDKIHLVPFGEFIPFNSIAFVHSVLMKLGPSGYEDYVLTPGEENPIPVFDLPSRNGENNGENNGESHGQSHGQKDWRFVTPICFEDIVGPLVAEMIRGGNGSKRADFIVNLTNDGWFSGSEMPQHLQAAVFRSIENRVPTARSVNTGISGFIDSVGRVHDTVAAKTAGWNVATLSLDDRVAFYTVHGDIFAESCAAVSGLLVLWIIFKGKRNHKIEKGRKE